MPPRKRARTSTGADSNDSGAASVSTSARRSAAPPVAPPPPAVHSTANLAEILSHMTPAMQRKFLTEAATAHADVMSSLEKWNEKRLVKIQKDAEKLLTTEQKFSHLVDKVWDLVDKAANKDCSASKAYDVAHGLLRKIEDNMLKPILGTVKPESIYKTKANAIESVCEIFSICLLNTLGTAVGQIVRGHGNFFGFGNYLLDLLGMCSNEELVWLMESEYTFTNVENGEVRTGTWMESFEETYKYTKSYCVQEKTALGTEEALGILRAAREAHDAEGGEDGGVEEYEEGYYEHEEGEGGGDEEEDKEAM
ncbi:hypothetical protein QBC37DRAFT_393018 [Rhypophila decipiens]|uniref:Uncharacterized protein n=1 Tax=Rhypophila decipiens TaxID=261697 RepID=A0AAN6XV11_9PEZI|nr:hypothetical protein QBC37DRAFT_393018 [Rhypophila decipiens]